MNEQEFVGVIYILVNRSFPDLIKFGYADDMDKRLSQLNSNSGLPYSFRPYATYKVTKKLTDKALFSIIDDLSPGLRTREEEGGKTRVREFFNMTPEQAYNILECIAKVSGTEDRLERSKLDKVQKELPKTDATVSRSIGESSDRRPPFSFSKCGIKPGEKVVFLNHPEYVATVLDDKHVEYEGGKYSLSDLSAILLHRTTRPQGTIFWTYNGQILDERRKEMESKGLYK